MRHRGILSAGVVVFLLGLACSGPTDESPTPLPHAPPPTSTPSSPSLAQPAQLPTLGLSVPPVRPGAGEWPFVLERPLGSDFIPLEAAAIIYTAMLFRDWDDLIALRAKLDPEVRALNDLRRRDTLTEAQTERRSDLLNKLGTLDNLMMGVEMALNEGATGALSTVEGNLGFKMWSIEYKGDGLWRVDTTTGAWEYDEATNIAGPVEGPTTN